MGSHIRELFERIFSIFHRRELDDDFNEEFASHIEMATEDNIQSGMSPQEARRQALIRFGGVEPAIRRKLTQNPLILLADEPTGNLDSKNGEAVMKLLRDLHNQGATICMVTHDPRYAEFADRRIHLFDGRITEEPVDNSLMAAG